MAYDHQARGVRVSTPVLLVLKNQGSLFHGPVFLVVQLPRVPGHRMAFVAGVDKTSPKPNGVVLVCQVDGRPLHSSILSRRIGDGEDARSHSIVTPASDDIDLPFPAECPPFPFEVPIVVGIQYEQPTAATWQCTIVHPVDHRPYRVAMPAHVPPFDVAAFVLGIVFDDKEKDPTAPASAPLMVRDPMGWIDGSLRPVHEIQAYPYVPRPLTDAEMRVIHEDLTAKWAVEKK